MEFKYDGLNKLHASLSATRVLSDAYAQDVFGLALLAVGEAFDAGRAQGRHEGEAEAERTSHDA